MQHPLNQYPLRQYQLNEYQEAAVLDDSPACVVNANVGSGKTTVLIEKIMYLHYEKSIPLEEMLVLTFTNKAAAEIIQRLQEKEPSLRLEQIQGFGTFHSVALELLKNWLPIESLGWTSDFTVIEPEAELQMAEDLILSHKLKVKYKNRLKKRLEQEFEGYRTGKENSRYKDDLFLLYPLLEAEKKKQNKMSFSDLLLKSIALLKSNPNVLTERKLKWIIVDEVQDSDALQLEFLKAVKREETKLFAVGDPNQVIYSWRGTGPNMFFLLKHQFQARELSLPINYRSDATILEAANRFLQYGTPIQGNREPGNKITVKKHYDSFLEAQYLAETIRNLVEQGKNYGDIAILFRLQKQSKILEDVFSRYAIPYQLPQKAVYGEKIEEQRSEELEEERKQERKQEEKTEELETEERKPEERKGKLFEKELQRQILEKEEKVNLMTLHATKGLEFDTVFILGLNQGMIPLRCKNFEQEEEERRLFFVGITRAKNNLELSYYTNPAEPGVLSEYSRYLKMLPPHLLNWENQEEEKTGKDHLQQLRKELWESLKKEETQAQKIQEQETWKKESEEIEPEKKEEKQEEKQEAVLPQAKHPKYGTGILVSEDDQMVEVEFSGYGRKQFLKIFGEVTILR